MKKLMRKLLVTSVSILLILFYGIPLCANEQVEMTTYYLILLMKGPIRNQSEAEVALLQKEHIGHLTKLGQAGKIVIAGPFTDDGTIRGIAVYKVASLEEARSLAEQDPAVKAGRLAVEVHPWMVQKGILP